MKPPAKKAAKVPLRRQRIRQAEKDVSRGLKDTERRGVPSDVPARKKAGMDSRGIKFASR